MEPSNSTSQLIYAIARALTASADPGTDPTNYMKDFGSVCDYAGDVDAMEEHVERVLARHNETLAAIGRLLADLSGVCTSCGGSKGYEVVDAHDAAGEGGGRYWKPCDKCQAGGKTVPIKLAPPLNPREFDSNFDFEPQYPLDEWANAYLKNKETDWSQCPMGAWALHSHEWETAPVPMSEEQRKWCSELIRLHGPAECRGSGQMPTTDRRLGELALVALANEILADCRDLSPDFP